MKNIKKQEKVSIIIPIFNAEKWIRDTIENIKQQTYTNYEIILIDDASTDNSRKIIEQYKDKNIKKIYLKENQGPAIARNKGLEIATGRYICFQDATDIWNKSKLEKQINFMENINCAFSYTGFEFLKKGRRKRVHVPIILDYKKALKDIRILTISVMIDREKISDELIRMPNIGAEDVATWWKILKVGYKAYGIDEVLVYYRIIPHSLSSNKIKSARNRWKIYRRIEELDLLKSLYYFVYYIFNAIRKRII